MRSRWGNAFHCDRARQETSGSRAQLHLIDEQVLPSFNACLTCGATGDGVRVTPGCPPPPHAPSLAGSPPGPFWSRAHLSILPTFARLHTLTHYRGCERAHQQGFEPRLGLMSPAYQSRSKCGVAAGADRVIHASRSRLSALSGVRREAASGRRLRAPACRTTAG